MGDQVPTKAILDRCLLGAASDGKTAVCALLIERAANPKSTPKDDGVSPLMAAADLGHLSVVKVLLEGEADVEQQDAYSNQTNLRDHTGNPIKGAPHNTALMRAALRHTERHADVLQELLFMQADWGRPNAFGETAVDMCSGFEPHEEVFRRHR